MDALQKDLESHAAKMHGKGLTFQLVILHFGLIKSTTGNIDRFPQAIFILLRKDGIDTDR